MTIEVKLRDIEVDGVVYPVPTHLTWHKTPRRWAILLPDANGGPRQVIGFPAKRHGSVLAAFIAAIHELDVARKKTETVLQCVRTQLYECKRDKSLAVGIELDIQYQKVLTVHYLRVSVGSHTADTLIRRCLRLGIEGQYSKKHYDMVYAMAVKTRAFLLEEHAKLLLQKRAESEREVRKCLDHFIQTAAAQST